MVNCDVDVIWWTAKAHSHMLNHVPGLSNQNPGRLRLEQTAVSMNSLPGLPLLPLALAAGLSSVVKVKGCRIQGLEQ